MPSDFPRSPRLLKGALVSFPSQFLGPVPNVIVFQYNPAELSRTLADRTPPRDPSKKGAAKEDVYRIQGPPVETIRLSVELDATDQLESGHPLTLKVGLHPALASLEMLLYPTSEQKVKIDLLSGSGRAQVAAYDLPLTLFVWGAPPVGRVVPVRVTSFSVTEQAFDQMLNPIQAKVDLEMRVLTDEELKKTSIGRDAYQVYQTRKEAFARLGLASSAEQITSMLPF